MSLLHLLMRTWFLGLMPLGFLGIGQGASKQETDIFNLLQPLVSFGSNTGQKGVKQSQSYWSDILSGDPTKMAAAIAPETKVIQGQAQQRKNQIAEFGTRSGGTAASTAAIDTGSTSAIQDLINKLRPEAAGQLSNQGLGLLGIAGGAGANAYSAAANQQAQSATKWGDIFKTLASVGLIAYQSTQGDG